MPKITKISDEQYSEILAAASAAKVVERLQDLSRESVARNQPARATAWGELQFIATTRLKNSAAATAPAVSKPPRARKAAATVPVIETAPVYGNEAPE